MIGPLPDGALLEGRYRVERLIAQGGMSWVFRAQDLEHGRSVALKLARDESSAAAIEREAELLTGLRHPHVVSLEARGRTTEGAPFIALEWVEGEDLGERLRRGPLSVREALRLAERVAGALGALHTRGVVHRDLKPGNLRLRGGDLDALTLIDFGIAGTRATPAPRAGELVGTPQYMAPEQIRGDADAGPPIDIFALGCVLWECLTGAPPFQADELVALLARILFEDPPDLLSLRPGLPQPVAALLARMLARDPALRPQSGAALAAALDALGPVEEGCATPAPEAEAQPALRGELQQLLSLLIARAPGQGVSLEEERALLSGLGGRAERLNDGSLVAVFGGWSSALDQVSQAARAALALTERWPEAAIALATGRVAGGRSRPTGEALDRAAVLLLRAQPGEILVDEPIAGLLSRSHALRRRPDGSSALHGPKGSAEDAPPPLGRRPICLGRERELLELAGALGSLEEQGASVLLITGPSGSGKSCLRREFLERAQQDRPLRLALAQGAPMAQGLALGLLAQVVLDLCGAPRVGEDLLRRQRLESHVRQRLPGADSERTAAFLVELCQLSEASEPPEQVRAARQDPALSQAQLRRALVELLRAESHLQPVVLVLEDLHWADVPSLRLLDESLAELRAQPLLVLGLSQPGLQERVPGLWRGCPLRTLSLPGLGRGECAGLIRAALGGELDPEIEEHLISQSGGNALFLEELIRAVAEGRPDLGATTVLAMLQSRLSALPEPARRALCAASVFGGSFDRASLAALVATPSDALEALLEDLAQQYIIDLHGDKSPRTPLAFRHILMRDAAYSLLDEQDRTLGHLLAARHLEGIATRDSASVARHYELGGRPDLAGIWHKRAADRALDAGDPQGAAEHAQLALDAGTLGGQRGQLYSIQATAAYWRRDDAEACRLASQALALLATGSGDWFRAVAQVLVSGGRGHDWALVERWLPVVTEAQPSRGAEAAQALCLARTGFMFVMQGCKAEVQQIARRLDELPPLPEDEPIAIAQLSQFQAGRALSAGDSFTGVALLERALAAFERAGDARNLMQERSTLACYYIEVGQPERAEPLCTANIRACQAAGALAEQAQAEVMLGYGLSFFPDRLEEAEHILRQAIARSQSAGARRQEGWGRAALSRLHFVQGRWAESEAQAWAAAELMVADAGFRAWPLGWRARALVRLNRAQEALACAADASERLRLHGGYTMGVTVPALARIEALRALGRSDEALLVQQKSHQKLLLRASQISDPRWRERLLKHPENALLMV